MKMTSLAATPGCDNHELTLDNLWNIASDRDVCTLQGAMTHRWLSGSVSE